MEQIIQGNADKYYRYKYAHQRLQLALKHGFYIEAAMLCESMIADRLHSHLHWRVHEAAIHPSSFFGKYAICISYGPEEVVSGKAAYVPFKSLVKMYGKCLTDDHRADHPTPPRWVSSKKTVSPVVLAYWADERNAVAHGSVKTHPTRKSYDENFQAFQERAEQCALNGVDLVSLLSNWDATVRRAQRRQAT